MKNILFILLVCCSLNGFGQGFFGEMKFVIEQYRTFVFEERCDTMLNRSNLDIDTWWNKAIEGTNSAMHFGDTLVVCYDDTNRFEVKYTTQHLMITDLKENIKYKYSFSNETEARDSLKIWKTCRIKYASENAFKKDFERILLNSTNQTSIISPKWLEFDENFYRTKGIITQLYKADGTLKNLVGGIKIDYIMKDNIYADVLIFLEEMDFNQWKKYKKERSELKKRLKQRNN